MTGRATKLIRARPRDAAERWVDTGRDDAIAPSKAETYTARLTIDITPALRGRIKVAAFERGITVADMLRTLLDERFGGPSDDPGQTAS
ncbi:MAG: hypothetical protein P4L90_01925 [Rhodopila sp.]|nr:hypothetical protein [Rhodopila sp.]